MQTSERATKYSWIFIHFICVNLCGLITMGWSTSARGQAIQDAELPFKYLNQYFAYDINEVERQVTINDQVFKLDELTVSSVETGFDVRLSPELAKFFEGGLLFVRPKNRQNQAQLNLIIEPATVNTELTYQLYRKKKISLKNMTDVCLEKSSAFSLITICKSINSPVGTPGESSTQSPEAAQTQVVVDDSTLGLSGQVILQESQRRTQFKINFTNQDSFTLETERRKVYPATLNKKSNSEKVDIRFVDLSDQTVAWEETITIQQRYVEFRLDPILSVRQDILFSDPDILSKEISQQLIERAKVTVVAKNSISVLPQVGVVQFAGESFDLNFKLRSPMSVGLHIEYFRYLSSTWNWLIEMNYMTTAISIGESDLILDGASTNRYQFLTGFEHDFSSRLEIQFSIGARNDIFPTPINVFEGIKINQGLNDFIETRLQWNAFENEYIEFLFPVKLRAYPPGQAGAVEAKLGTGYEFGASARAKTKWGRIKAGLVSGARNQKYEDVDLKEIYYFVSVGALYLF